MNKLTRVTVIILMLAAVMAPVRAQENVQISLITCSEGDALYAAFGHTALRVVNFSKGYDVVFNFGLFDFDTPNFGMKFTRGNLKYRLGIQQYDRFMRSYIYENRSVWEQVLNLPPQKKAAILTELERRYQPQNRYYLYHFLERNCTTELRDILFAYLPENIEYVSIPVDDTYRDLLNHYIKKKHWLRVGINIIMGNRVDQPINSFQKMALPESLMNGVAAVKSGEFNLVKKNNVLFQAKPKEARANWFYSPFVVFSLLLIVALFVKKRWFLFLYFLLFGITGLIITLVWIFSSHMELSNNWNVLWANPLYLVLAALVVIGKDRLRKALSVLLLIGLIAAVVVWILRVQYVEPSFIPVVATLAVMLLQPLFGDSLHVIGMKRGWRRRKLFVT